MKIAIAGLGTVGAGVIQLLNDNAEKVVAHAGEPIEIVGVSARKKRDGLPWYDNPLDLVKTDAEVIVELIGGDSGIAYELVKAALQAKKHVVTANKALLANHGGELAELAETNDVQLCYEAAVAGGIPVIKVLREGLAANKITRLTGILNGTCNYILTQMELRNAEFPEILKEAQEKGYAEADPLFDVGGIDAAHKLALLAAIAFGKRPNFKELFVEGIDKIKVADIASAKKLGYRIKHICFASNIDGKIQQRAHPCLLPESHSLANINDVFNAVEIEGDPVGKIVLNGRGAGSGPTASAVCADIIDLAHQHDHYEFMVPAKQLGVLHAEPMDEISSAYYIRLNAADKPGVLEEITSVFKDAAISIHKFFQDEVRNNIAQIVIITHSTKEKSFKAAAAELEKLGSIVEKPQIIRIIG